jgi:hypothetical protein
MIRYGSPEAPQCGQVNPPLQGMSTGPPRLETAAENLATNQEMAARLALRQSLDILHFDVMCDNRISMLHTFWFKHIYAFGLSE